MSFFRGNTQITGGTIQNVAFSSPSSCDMSNVRITNTGDPIIGTDAVNKRSMVNYVTQGVAVLQTNLQGFVPVVIDDRVFGSFHITVSGTTEGNPVGAFVALKASRTQSPTIQVLSSLPGSGGSRLGISWPPNTGILLSKTGAGDDGIYVIKII